VVRAVIVEDALAKSHTGSQKKSSIPCNGQHVFVSTIPLFSLPKEIGKYEGPHCFCDSSIFIISWKAYSKNRFFSCSSMEIGLYKRFKRIWEIHPTIRWRFGYFVWSPFSIPPPPPPWTNIFKLEYNRTDGYIP